MRRKLGVWALGFTVWMMGTVALPAATNNCADCALLTVSNAVFGAANGDTITCPAGSWTWNAGLDWTTKGLFIIGAGEGQTVITDNTTGNGYTVDIHNITNKLCRLSGFTFKAGSGSYSVINVGRTQTAGGGASTCRLDHITVTNVQNRGFNLTGESVGLVDHCTVRSTGGMTAFDIEGYDDGSTKPKAWTNSFSISARRSWVIEDCCVDMPVINNGAMDTYASCDWQFRFSTITNGSTGNHGTDSSGTYRATVACIINNCKIYGTAAGAKSFLGNFRGGTVLTYSNAMFGNNAGDDGAVHLSNYRNTGTNLNYEGTTPCCSPWGPVSGTNVWDGNTDQYGYPALDQMGRVPPTTYGATSTVQVLSPCYAWSNTLSISSGATNDVSYHVLQANFTNTGSYTYIPATSRMIQANRDFYDYTVAPGYTPSQYPDIVIAMTEGTSPAVVTNAVFSGKQNGVGRLEFH